MATPKTVTGLLKGPDDLPRPGLVTITLSQPCIIPGTNEAVNTRINIPVPATGVYSASLYSNNDLTPTGTYYDVVSQTADGATYKRTIVVPQTAGPFVITSIETAPPTPGASPSHVSTLTVDGSPTGMAVNAAGDIAGRSLTAQASAAPYASNLPGNAAIPTPAGVVAGKLRDWGGQVYDVFAAGAKGDTQFVTDGAMASGSAVLTSASNLFAAADVGKLVTVPKAGALVTPPAVALTAVDGGAGASTLPTGSYTFVLTWVTGFGETTIGSSQLVYSQTVANHIITLTLPTLPAAAGAWKLYCTVAPNGFTGLIGAGGATSFAYTVGLTAANGKAAPGANGASTTLVTTIASYQSPGQVTLTAANASGSTVSASFVNWGTDDTAAFTTAFAAAPYHEVAIPPVPVGYMVTAAISIPLQINSIRGGGVRSLFGGSNVGYPTAQNMPTLAPFIAGSVIIQTGTGIDGFQSQQIGPTINFPGGVGVRFTNWFAGTGHGFNINPPTLGIRQDSGIYDSVWTGCKVFGHDGNHYAFNLTNPMLNVYHGIRGYGGGVINMSENSGNSTPFGNEVFNNPYGVLFVAGTANGINSKSVVSPSGIMFTAWIRPQVWVQDITNHPTFASLTPPYTLQNGQCLQKCLATDAGVSRTTWIVPDFETNVGAKAQFPTGGYCFIGAGIWSGGGYNDINNNPASGASAQNTSGTGIMWQSSITLNPTGGAAATVLAETSPDNASWTTQARLNAPATGLAGQIQQICFYVPSNYWYRITYTNAVATVDTIGLVQQGV